MGAAGQAEGRVRQLQVRVRPLPRPQRDDARAHHLLHRRHRPEEERLRLQVQRKDDAWVVDTWIEVKAIR